MFKKLVILFTCSAVLGCSSTREAKNEVAKINSTDIVEFSSKGERMVSQIRKSNGQYVFEFNLSYKQLPAIYSGSENLTKVAYSCKELTSNNSVCQVYSNSLEYSLINKKTKLKEVILISQEQLSD